MFFLQMSHAEGEEMDLLDRRGHDNNIDGSGAGGGGMNTLSTMSAVNLQSGADLVRRHVWQPAHRARARRAVGRRRR